MLMIGLYNQAPSNGGTLLLDATPFVTSAAFSTDVHGNEALNITVLRPLAEAFKLYNQTAVVYVGVFEGASLIWEGRLEDPALNTGAGGSGFRGQALGYWRALTDTPYTALWTDTRVVEWEIIPETAGVAFAPQRYAIDFNNRIFIGLQKNATYGNNTDVGEVAYRIADRSSRQIIGIQLTVDCLLPNNWNILIVRRTSIFGVLSVVATMVCTGVAQSRSFHLTFTGADCVSIEVVNATGAPVTFLGETGANFARMTKLRVVTTTTNRVNTVTTLARTNGASVTVTVVSTAGMYVGMQLVLAPGVANSEIVTVLSIPTATTFTADVTQAPGGGYVIGIAVQGFQVFADEIARDLLSTVAALNSSQIATTTTQIQSPALDLTDEVYADQRPATILSYLASRGDSLQRAWEVGVGRGQALYFRPQFTASRAWFVDATDLTLARTLNNLFNSAYGLYEEAGGRAQRTTTSSNAASVARYALTRRTSAPASTTNATLAGVQRDTFITNNDDPLPRATVRFDAVYDAQGARWPLYLVKAGDTITVRNVPPSISSSYDLVRTFRVTHTTYDLLANMLTVEPDLAPPTIASMIVQQTSLVTNTKRSRDALDREYGV